MPGNTFPYHPSLSLDSNHMEVFQLRGPITFTSTRLARAYHFTLHRANGEHTRPRPALLKLIRSVPFDAVLWGTDGCCHTITSLH
jgi:hypothetical protein